MRTREDIEGRIRVLLVEELDRRMADASLRLPVKCKHNHRQPLDTRRNVDGERNSQFNRISTSSENGRALPVIQTIGLCMLGAEKPEDWAGTICEDPIDAQRCPVFDPTATKEAVLKSFEEDLSDQRWVALHMPQLIELRWVLAEERDIQVPWWKRILFKFARIRIPKPLPPFDPDRLPPPT